VFKKGKKKSFGSEKLSLSTAKKEGSKSVLEALVEKKDLLVVSTKKREVQNEIRGRGAGQPGHRGLPRKSGPTLGTEPRSPLETESPPRGEYVATREEDEHLVFLREREKKNGNKESLKEGSFQPDSSHHRPKKKKRKAPKGNHALEKKRPETSTLLTIPSGGTPASGLPPGPALRAREERRKNPQRLFDRRKNGRVDDFHS